MSPQAISKLRRSFILIAAASFFVVIAFMGIATLATNMMVVWRQADVTIDAILDAGGQTPTEANYANGKFPEEASYGLRFFTVSFDENGKVTNVDLSHIAVVDEDRAIEVAQDAADPQTFVGLKRDGNFFYKEGVVDGGSMVVFLDCSLQVDTMFKVVYDTLGLSLVVFLVTLASIVFFSKRAVQSEVDNAHRQQQFMTNASHELKTPIAVIRANTELTEMLSGETEWTQSTLSQVDRLDGLVRNLMTIVRGQELDAEGKTSSVDVTAVVGKAAESFLSVVEQQGLGFKREIAEGVTVTGTESSVEQLTCLLVDNAIKYCDEGGAVSVSLSPARMGRGCVLAVSNDYAEGADVDYQRFFERFFREDTSHENQQGYGIGLSVAESICERYHGAIKASWKAGIITFTCTLKGA